VSDPSPAEILAALPPATRALVERVLGAARARGEAVHLVGGPVRDFLLGRPLVDVDLIVEAADGGGAEALARAAAPEGARAVAHGRFGTVRLESGAAALDIAGVRRERYAHPGALPTVEPAGLEEDLARRDFTVNALAVPLSPAARKARPALIDLAGGRADLEARILRVLHPRSFHDDPTRALRAARLAARLGFQLSRGTQAALRDALRDGAFGRVSGERLRREFERAFEEAAAGVDPARTLGNLAEWHVLAALEPGLDLPRSARAPLRRLGRALARPTWPLARCEPWEAGLAVWLAPLEPGLRGRTLRRLAVRGDRARRIAGFPRARDRWLRELARARGRGAVDAALRGVDEASLLALAAWAPAPIARRIARFAREDRGRHPPVNGADLVALGLAGPGVGEALARIRAAWLDGAVRTREDALALGRELAGRGARPARPRRPRAR
jgi:tRNA nucleotidyltransferase (CCA-adding enzyme)